MGMCFSAKPREIVVRCINITVDFSFKSLKFLLVDSKVGRNTKQLVANVGQKKMEVIVLDKSRDECWVTEDCL